MMFVDETLVGNDKFIYADQWCSQPIAMNGRYSSFLYITLAFHHKEGMNYFIYPLRTEIGGKLLEVYHGRYLSKKGLFTDVGINILLNITRMTYEAPYFTLSGFKSCFSTLPPEEMITYKIQKFMKREGK